MAFLHHVYCRESLRKTAINRKTTNLLFNNSNPNLYVEVKCVQNWVENGLVEPGKCWARNMLKRDANPF